jgi:hypothetical protein
MTDHRSDPNQAQFRRFEKVLVESEKRLDATVADRRGTVIWVDRPATYSGHVHWTYCVYHRTLDRHLSVLESELRSTDDFDSEDAFLGTRFEISHDLVPDDDGTFAFVEGTYRLPGKFWEVMIFSKWDVPKLRYRPMTWESGITGTTFYVPEGDRLDKAFVERAMTGFFLSKSKARIP